MRRWETWAVIGAILVVLGLPAAVFGYQGYRESQLGRSTRPPSVVVPRGDALAGRQVYLAKCAACHGRQAQGTPAGPNVRQVGRAGALFVYSWILDPGSVTDKATMPRIPLTEKELADVTEFIMSLKDQPSPPAQAEAAVTETPTVVPSEQKAATRQPTEAAPAPTSTRLKPMAAGDVARGKALYTSKGCAACHGPKGQGTAAAPPLNDGHSPEEVKAQVRNPKGNMPAFGPNQISDAELEDLAAFVASLK